MSAAARCQTIEEKAQVCSACHGESGIPLDKAIPIIWGQHAGYLYLQLRDFKKGVRKNEQMSPIAEALEKDDMTALADYFSQKQWPRVPQPAASADDATVARRVNGSIGCTGCHLDQYQGDGSIPRIADQQHDYLIKTMLDFRARTRANNPGMSDLMNAASEDELKAMAAYLAGF
ncbi:MAG: c-type cytochrome [Beijerinckiaceae bacterium]